MPENRGYRTPEEIVAELFRVPSQDKDPFGNEYVMNGRSSVPVNPAPGKGQDYAPKSDESPPVNPRTGSPE